jgi:hypothetical protein
MGSPTASFTNGAGAFSQAPAPCRHDPLASPYLCLYTAWMILGKRVHGDPRQVEVVHFRCANCDHHASFSNPKGDVCAASLAPRGVCTNCGLRCAEVSSAWHQWPDDKLYLRELPELPIARGPSPTGRDGGRRRAAWVKLLAAIRKRPIPIPPARSTLREALVEEQSVAALDLYTPRKQRH